MVQSAQQPQISHALSQQITSIPPPSLTAAQNQSNFLLLKINKKHSAVAQKSFIFLVVRKITMYYTDSESSL